VFGSARRGSKDQSDNQQDQRQQPPIAAPVDVAPPLNQRAVAPLFFTFEQVLSSPGVNGERLGPRDAAVAALAGAVSQPDSSESLAATLPAQENSRSRLLSTEPHGSEVFSLAMLATDGSPGQELLVSESADPLASLVPMSASLLSSPGVSGERLGSREAARAALAAAISQPDARESLTGTLPAAANSHSRLVLTEPQGPEIFSLAMPATDGEPGQEPPVTEAADALAAVAPPSPDIEQALLSSSGINGERLGRLNAAVVTLTGAISQPDTCEYPAATLQTAANSRSRFARPEVPASEVFSLGMLATDGEPGQEPPVAEPADELVTLVPKSAGIERSTSPMFQPRSGERLDDTKMGQFSRDGDLTTQWNDAPRQQMLGDHSQEHPPEAAPNPKARGVLPTPVEDYGIAAKQPVREIAIEASDPEGRTVHLRFQERAGEIRVEARSTNESLASQVRSHIPELVSRLEASHFTVREVSAAESVSRDTIVNFKQTLSGEAGLSRDASGGRQSKRYNQSNPGRKLGLSRPSAAWFEQFHAAYAAKENA
jgi:hypothetical protein